MDVVWCFGFRSGALARGVIGVISAVSVEPGRLERERRRMKDVLFFHRFKARTHKSKVDRDKDSMGKTE